MGWHAHALYFPHACSTSWREIMQCGGSCKQVILSYGQCSGSPCAAPELGHPSRGMRGPAGKLQPAG